MIVMTYLWNILDFKVHFFAILFNTAIHTLMYYYYAILSLGYTVWWKKYVTTMQLIQFISVFVVICIWFWRSVSHYSLQLAIDYDRTRHVSMFVPSIRFQQGKIANDCAGTLGIGFVSQIVNVSFLVLFALFYARTYNRKSKNV